MSLLKQYCQGDIPLELFNDIETNFLANVARSLYFAEEFLKVLTLFSMHNIDVVPFKGPALTVSAYGNLSCRKFSDLDILVSPLDFE